MIGLTISNYRITAKLGEGGMGAVYRATDTRLNRDVAIKVLPDAFAADSDRLARFTREAQVLASLNHPNIAAIYGIEERAIVMELVEGQTLAERTASGALGWDQAMEIAAQIAAALEAAHEKGVVHRDLKPDNVKITPDGVVKVLDFGLAKLTDPAAQDRESAPTITQGQSPTIAGMIMGTAEYMSPEQARGQAVDRRADIWAFGVVLWEMLTGRRLFTGETVSDVLAGVLKNEVDLSVVPQASRRLLARCLERDPRKRLRDISVWRELLPAVTPAPVVTTSWSSGSKWPWAVAVAAIAVAAIAGWALWKSPRGNEHRGMVYADLEVPPDAAYPAISRDGSLIAYVSNRQIWLRRLDQAHATAVSATEGATFPFFSPDGKWIGFFANRKLFKVSVEGGIPTALCDAPFGRGGAWTEDGQIVASLSVAGGLSRISAEGGEPTPLPFLVEPAVTSHRWPQSLPGGAILFSANNAGKVSGSVRVLPPNGAQAKTLVPGSSYGRYAAGYLFFLRNATLYSVPMDVRRLELTGTPRPLIEKVGYDSSAGGMFEVSASGTVVCRRGSGGGKHIVSWVTATGEAVPAIRAPGDYLSLTLSPDGRRVALLAAENGRQGLSVFDFTRDTITRLPASEGADSVPSWSPDGEYLAYDSSEGVAWVRSDGAGTAHKMQGAYNRPSFSPDGNWLLMSKWNTAGGEVFMAPVTRSGNELQVGNPVALLQAAVGSEVSPDGRWLASTTGVLGQGHVFVQRFLPPSGGVAPKWQVSDSLGGARPQWAKSARILFYEGAVGPFRTVSYLAWSENGDTFVPGKVAKWGGPGLANTGPYRAFTASHDGKRILGIYDSEQLAPETHLRLILNVTGELDRRAASGGEK